MNRRDHTISEIKIVSVIAPDKLLGTNMHKSIGYTDIKVGRQNIFLKANGTSAIIASELKSMKIGKHT